jgi:hypothetical protein
LLTLIIEEFSKGMENSEWVIFRQDELVVAIVSLGPLTRRAVILLLFLNNIQPPALIAPLPLPSGLLTTGQAL